MNTHVKTLNTMERFSPDSRNTADYKHSMHIKALAQRLLDHLLYFIEPIVEYSFGMFVGACIGWMLGWGAGNVYVEYFRPVYFSSLNEITQWSLMPYDFAGYGAIIGVFAGAIAIAIINSKLLGREVVTSYENGVTEPKDIAHALGKGVQHIQKVMNKLSVKGRIAYEIAGSQLAVAA